MRTRYFKGHWARKYREAAADMSRTNYYDGMIAAVAEHINSRDFSDRATDARYPLKIVGLIQRVTRAQPKNHIRAHSLATGEIIPERQAMIDRAPVQIAGILTAFVSAVSTDVLAKPEVRLPLKSVCDQLPDKQRSEVIGWMASKFDIA